MYLALRDLRNPAPLVHETHFPRRGVTVTVHCVQIQLHDWIAYVTLHLCYINMWILWILVGFFICLSFFKNLTFTILFVNHFDAVFLNITPWLQYKSGLSACHCIKKNVFAKLWTDHPRQMLMPWTNVALDDVLSNHGARIEVQKSQKRKSWQLSNNWKVQN